MPARPQFRLRSLLKTMAAWALILSIVAWGVHWRNRSVRHQQSMDALAGYGGTTSMASALHSIRTKGRDDWSWWGLRFANYVEAVDLSIHAWPRESQDRTVIPLEDDALPLLFAFPRLGQLNLRGAGITDGGLQHLGQLTELKRLDLSGTQVTEGGVRKLQTQLPNCEIIRDPHWRGERSPLAEAYWLAQEMGLDR